jgi:GH25 family lysozyme M1 (1,4-beta-N-acetylmuramidase)
MRSVPRRVRGRRTLALAASAMLGLLPALTSCTAPPPPAAQARGIDVSNYQHPGNAPINWPQVRGSGIEFAFIKATEGPVGCNGSYYTNNWLRRDWSDSAAAGLYRGAYHFARPGDAASAINQARYFVSAVGAMNGPRDLPPVLDLESTCGLSPWDLAIFARTWVGEVQRLTGRTPIIYTYFYFWQDQLLNDSTFSGLPLWIATYGPRPMVPRAWAGWTFWQHSSTGAVPGISGNVDLNVFAFSSDALSRFVVEGASNPRGSLDLAAGGAGSVTVGGWALDLDDRGPLDVHVYVDAKGYVLRADGDRPDVGAAFGTAGPAHGFHAVLPDVPGGRHQVCAYGINVGPGANVKLGCAALDVAAIEPFGSLDAVTGGPRRIDVGGWAVDPDTPAPVPIHVYVDGALAGASDATGWRPDVSGAFPGVSPTHGFQFSIAGMRPGRREVCAYAINIAGYGTSQLLGCRPTTVT